MRIRYLSDLHLEFIDPHKIHNFIHKNIRPGLDEICVLAGDVGNPWEANYDAMMRFANANFKHTFVIPGNHEYYKHTISGANQYMANYFEQFANITFLNNSHAYYDNHCFIGTTLWSHISDPTHKINDVHRIADFNCQQYNELHRGCREYLEDTVKKNSNCIVLTHHLPMSRLTDAKYKTPQMEPYHQWFSCDLDEFIGQYQDNIKLWIYGHTHTPSNVVMYNIPFLCNPIGYPNENLRNHFNKYHDI
jgi:predicted phosphohydrolase